MKNKQKNIALVGFGYWGKNILRNLYELDVLHTACDMNSNLINEYKNKFPKINYTDSIETVLKSKDISAVVISTPAGTHFDLVKQSLVAGKDVFVEKPLALTVKEGEELVELADKKNQILMVGHILQYHPAINKLKEIITEGALGKIQYIYSNRLNIGKLRTEENILWSFAPHDISVIVMLLDEEPISVSAFGGDYLNKGINDITLTTMEFRNGVRGHIFVSWLHPYKEQKLIVVGSKAMAVFDDVSSEKLFLYPHQIKWKDGKIPVAQKADFQVIQIEKDEPLKLELEHFIDCMQTRKKPKTDGVEGLRVLKILEAAENSLKSSAVVTFEEKQIQQNKNYFVHSTACIDEDVEIGAGAKIWHFCHISKGARIGRNCTLGQNVFVGRNAVIGNNCKIQNNVSVYEGVTLEDDVFCGPSMVFTNVDRPRSAYPRGPQGYLKTLVKRGCTIGANATILCGITLGEYSFIGAGALVTKDVPPYALVYGNPARIQGWICECGTRLVFKERLTRCSACGRAYEQLSEDAIRKVEGRLEK